MPAATPTATSRRKRAEDEFDRLGKIKTFRDRANYLWNSPVIRMLFK